MEDRDEVLIEKFDEKSDVNIEVVDETEIEVKKDYSLDKKDEVKEK